MFGFEYEIIDGEITITHLKDRSITSIYIPEFIGYYPVTGITHYALDGHLLLNVNGYDISDNTLIINNKFILERKVTYKITYNIVNEFTSSYMCKWNYRYFMNNILYDINFKAVY